MKKLTLLCIALISVMIVNAQNNDTKSKKEIKAEKEALQAEQANKMIESRNYMFVPQTAMPSRGQMIAVSSYNLKVTGDKMVSYLPYYGRSYTAPVDNMSSPLNFEGKLENYQVTTKKKKYLIKFNVKNGNDNISYSLEVFDKGSASLDVSSSSRQPISFKGQVEEIK